MKLSAATVSIFLFSVGAHAKRSSNNKSNSSKGKGSAEEESTSPTCYTNPVWQDVIFSLTSGDVIPMPSVETVGYGRRGLLQEDIGNEQQQHSLRKERAMLADAKQQRAPFIEEDQDKRHLDCGGGFSFSLAAPNQDACLIAGGYPIYAAGTFLACPTTCSLVGPAIVAQFCQEATCNMVVECEEDPAIVVGDFDNPKVYCCPKNIAVPP